MGINGNIKKLPKDKKPKEFTIFDGLKCIINTKPSWDSFTPEQKKIFNTYMINRFLSMNSNYIDIVNYIQGIPNLTEEKQYKIYCNLIPQNKNTYSVYIKSKNKKVSNDLVKYISEFYTCSLLQASEYLELMDKEMIEEILIAKGVDDKEIKKLLK